MSECASTSEIRIIVKQTVRKDGNYALRKVGCCCSRRGVQAESTSDDGRENSSAAGRVASAIDQKVRRRV